MGTKLTAFSEMVMVALILSDFLSKATSFSKEAIRHSWIETLGTNSCRARVMERVWQR